MPEQLNAIRMCYTAEYPAVSKVNACFKVTAICVVDVHTLPMLRFVVVSKAVDKMNAANQKIKSGIFCVLVYKILKLFEIAYL